MQPRISGPPPGSDDPEGFITVMGLHVASISQFPFRRIMLRVGGWVWACSTAAQPLAGYNEQTTLPGQTAATSGDTQTNPRVGPLGQETGDCELIGEVSDSTTLNPLKGVVVELGGLGRSAETDAQGKFRFTGLPAGEVKIEVSLLGYEGEIRAVSTLAGQPVEARFGLRKKPDQAGTEEFTLEEETVVGEYQGDSPGDVFTNLEVTGTVTSGLSKEDFAKTGVSDAAGAVGKIAGANIVGGKFAVVRGLADRYVATLFNGAAISSADPSRKAVQLDIFPTTAIQSVDIHKTYSPELPGDFGGGTISIQSLNLPQERIAEFKYKMGWNSKLGDRMLVHPDRKLGFLGNVDTPVPDALMWNLNTNGEPSSFDSGGNRITPGNTTNATLRQAQLNAANAEQAKANSARADQVALHQSQSFMPKVVKPEESQSVSMVYGDRVHFDNGNQLGWIAAFQHATQDDVNDAGPENRLTSPARSWTEESYSREVDWSAYLGTGIKVGDDHEFSATYFRKRIASDEISHGSDFQIEGDDRFGAFAKNDAVISRYGASAVYRKEFWEIAPLIRDTELAQLAGKHRNDAGTKLSWMLSQSSARESRPHTTTFQNGQLDFTDPRIAAEAAVNPAFVYNPSLGKISTIQYQTFVNDGIGSLDSSRETQSIEEKASEGKLDLTQSIYLTKDEEDGPRMDVSVGAGSIEKNREQQGRVYLLRNASWERWVARNPPSWWTSNTALTPFSGGSPLDATTLKDGSPLPAGFRNLGEYLAAHPDQIAVYFNGYGGERTGPVPGTGNTASSRANYVNPDAPYYVNGSGLEVRNVDSVLTLTSLYSSATLHTEHWRLGGGARWEEEVKSYEVAADPLTRLLVGDPARFGRMTTNALIPAAFAGLDVIPEEAWLNAAWSRTVARPTFHEFLPIESVSQDTGILRRGNPNLSETGIDNMDLSLDWNVSDSFRTRAAVFRKHLADPIVVVQRVDLGQNSNTYVNGDSGLISGLELEGSWKSAHFPISLTGNYTFIDSTLRYQVNQGLVITPLETRFPYQPGHIINLTLGWEPADVPWSAFLTGNLIDEYPTILRSEPSGYDVWLKPQLTLDLLVARKWDLDFCKATLTFGIRNLLAGTRDYEYRGGAPNGNSGAFSGLTYTEEDPGMGFSVEFKASF